MTKSIRVIIVDDHPIVREGLRMILTRTEDCQLIGEATDGKQALKCRYQIGQHLMQIGEHDLLLVKRQDRAYETERGTMMNMNSGLLGCIKRSLKQWKIAQGRH